MTRAVMIGNSHVGAFKLAWDTVRAEHSWLEMDFFAAPARRFLQFRLQENLRFGSLDDPETARRQRIADTSGRTSIDLSGADYVIWAGYRWRAGVVDDLMHAFDIEGLREVGAPRLMSRAAFDAICAALAEAGAPPPAWRGWTGRKPRLVLLPRAARADGRPGGPHPRSQIRNALAQEGSGRDVILAFLDTFARTLRDAAIEVVAQPRATLLPSGLTDPRFARGSRTLDDSAPHDDDDFSHMNADFGRLYLADVLARLKPA